MLLGNESSKTTMARYFHVTDESMNKAVQQIKTLFAYNGVNTITTIGKNIGNKGEMRIYETRYRRIT